MVIPYKSPGRAGKPPYYTDWWQRQMCVNKFPKIAGFLTFRMQRFMSPQQWGLVAKLGVCPKIATVFLASLQTVWHQYQPSALSVVKFIRKNSIKSWSMNHNHTYLGINFYFIFIFRCNHCFNKTLVSSWMPTTQQKLTLLVKFLFERAARWLLSNEPLHWCLQRSVQSDLQQLRLNANATTGRIDWRVGECVFLVQWCKR